MLELHEGARIESADGEHVGDVDRLVIHPSGRRVSHVVVRKGVFLRHDRVVPVEVIEQADHSLIRLLPTVDVEELPAFEEAHYVPLDDVAVRELGPFAGRSLAWAYPLTPTAGFPSYPIYPESARMEVERNVPEDFAVIEPGSHVLTIDGEDVGTIREVTTDESGALTHVTVDPGWFRSEAVIPAHWIRKVNEDTIEIGVGAGSLRDR